MVSHHHDDAISGSNRSTYKVTWGDKDHTNPLFSRFKKVLTRTRIVCFEGSTRLTYTGLLGGLVNDTMLFETLQVVGFTEDVRMAIRLRKKPMNLCTCDSEERERGVGAGVNDTVLFETLQVLGSGSLHSEFM